MTARPNLPPILLEPPPALPTFMASLDNDLSAVQNYDRHSDVGFLPPAPPLPQNPSQIPTPFMPHDPTQPLPPSPLPPMSPPPPPVPPQNPSQSEHVTNADSNGHGIRNSERPSDSGDGSGSDHSDGEDEDDQQQESRWLPIEEDKSIPCEDELMYISSKGEHSAVDHAYWQKKTFFDPEDPEIVPGDSGRIDWLVERFNGTKDNPNNEYLMKSPVVRIGAYDWQIKFYPKGNTTDYLSVYLECVNMQSSNFEAATHFTYPPLPFVAGMDKQQKRQSVACQLSVVMYNPAEPRVYEYQTDAHQFTKKLPDYGWTRFTRSTRREFSFRRHGQRQAILCNDKLAFSAYIRIVHDPTGCLWSHGTHPFDDSVALTGLRPFSPQFPWLAAQLPLLHFLPFRDFIIGCRDTKIIFWFQTLLWKMMSRKRSEYYSQPSACVQSDTIAWLKYAVKWLKRETNAAVVDDIIGSLDPLNGAAVSGNRLRTKKLGSVQAAVDTHSAAFEKPALLTLELERQEFNRKERRWHKLTNRVDMENKITVSGTSYTLYAFATQCGDLESNKFNLYIRPNGPGQVWYAYTEGNVTCLTRKQCVDKYCGFDRDLEVLKYKRHQSSRVDPSFRSLPRYEDRNEVAHVVMYIRDDRIGDAFNASTEQHWVVPENVRLGIPPTYDGVEEPPPGTAVYERFAESVAEDDQPSEQRNARRSSVIDAGYATPHCWHMDGEDVIMSDADDESTSDSHASANSEVAPDEHLTTQTIDHLGREYYQGDMLGPKYHGQGHLIAMNGDEYIGQFRNGQKSGSGKMIYGATGNTYEGDWAEDQHHGNGKLTEAGTGNVFEGGWKQGKKHGQFVLKGTVTDEDKGCCSICYDRDITTAFYDCGHVIACKECAHKIDNCPVCRKRVLARLELFGVRMTFE